jgi:beta-phosphoglucomutase-like phosphatase (HAD superfamily)
MAAKLLGVDPARSVVIALSGVQARSNGNFGLVIGIARKGNAEELQHHGAHVVACDLGGLVDWDDHAGTAFGTVARRKDQAFD